MNTLTVVVVALLFLGIGIGLCLLGVFCYFMLKMMKDLRESSAKVTEAAEEAARLANSLKDQIDDLVERMLGEMSPVGRASVALTRLTADMPQILSGFGEFSKTMKVFYKTAFVPNAVPGAAKVEEEFTGQIPYSEETAAQYEQNRKAVDNRIPQTEEQFNMMRTDKGRDVRFPEEETTPEVVAPAP